MKSPSASSDSPAHPRRLTLDRRWLMLLPCALIAAIIAGRAPAPAAADLASYVARPETAYRWELKQKSEHPKGTVYDLRLTSQVWQGITWEHQLQVYQPSGTQPVSPMLLMNTGGGADAADAALGMELAGKIGAPCAVLYHVPNQPLLDGKVEDALIAETFVRHLDTGDDNWPLLFPMVKSVVKAMDALQAFSEREWKKKIDGFVITGASKRGWTTWLTGASDRRVRAIAPMVIDMLNMREQTAHQKASFGDFSSQIDDYTRRGLVPVPETDRALRLWRMVDPYSYRDRLRMPKLILNGNNDPYWTVDALNLYWEGLPGDKWVTYVPNAGHDLRQRHANGTQDTSRAFNTLAAFVKYQVSGRSMPSLKWKHTDESGLRLTVQASPDPVAARLWVAHAPTRDFRRAAWKEQPLPRGEKGTWAATVPKPAQGFIAFYGDLDYETGGLRYNLCTQIRVAGAPAEAK